MRATKRSSVGRHASGAIVVSLALLGCEEKFFVAPPLDERADSRATISLLVTGDPVADGASSLQLRLRLTGAPTSARVAVVSTTTGSFVTASAQTATVAFGTDSSAVLLLRAPRDAGLGVVRAAIGGAVHTDTIRFRSALAESLLLQPKDSFPIRGDPSGQLVIEAQLRRSSGMVSPGASVTFSDSLQGARAGVFGIATTSGETGRVEVRYAPFVTDTTNTAPRKLYACTQGSTGPVCGSTTILVRKLP